MVVLPIVTRELRVAARRKATYRFRLSVAVGGLLVGGWIMVIPDLRTPQHLGMAMFTALSVVAFIESFLAGLVTTSDCVSEEKREGTLGLLFLTDLKGYDIVFGKLAATSLNSFYGLLAIFPVMAIPLLAGGVTGAEFGRVMLVAVNNLFFSLALGVLASSICREERAGGILTFLLLVFFAGLLPLIGGIASDWKRGPVLTTFLTLSPAYGAVVAFDSVYQSLKASGNNYFYASVICVHVFAWLFLVVACIIVPRSWQEKTERSAGFKWRDFWHRLRFGRPEHRIAYRQHGLTVNPFFWLASRDRLGVWLVWGILGIAALIWLWGLLKFKRDFLEEPAYFITGFLLMAILKMWLASEACRRFGQDRRSGALELILSTPLTVREILRGQKLALWRQFAGPSAVVLAAVFLFLWAERSNGDWVFMCVVGITIFVVDLIALTWVGMWMGLRSRHSNRATAAAVARIMVLPWLVWGILMTVLALTAFRWGNSPRWMDEEFVMVLWVFLSLAIDVGFALWARSCLLNDFRQVATERYDKRRRFSFFAKGSATVPVAPVGVPPTVTT